MSQGGFVWCSVTSQTAATFCVVTVEENKKQKQAEEIQFQTSKEQSAGIRHTCFVQVEQILNYSSWKGTDFFQSVTCEH